TSDNILNTLSFTYCTVGRVSTYSSGCRNISSRRRSIIILILIKATPSSLCSSVIAVPLRIELLHQASCECVEILFLLPDSYVRRGLSLKVREQSLLPPILKV